MKDFKFLIRFGVHKDRETIRSLSGSISGMIIPAHILCYSTNATIAAISYIQKREYYIDPMTYLYADSNIRDYVVLDEKTKKNRFKPSIAKLTESYGLTTFFEGRGFSQLAPSDFTDDFILELCKKNIELQTNKVDTEKVGAYQKYAELLKRVGENHIVEEIQALHTPAAIIPPYFFIKKKDSKWIEINKKLAEKTKENTSLPVMPIILTEAGILDKDLLETFKDFKNLFLWADDFEQKQTITQPQEAEFKNLASFIRNAESKGFKIINMRGTYFSILLGKLGLRGFSNGVFYGESKARKAAIGGIPPVRYYIRKLHEFFGIAEAIRLLKQYPELLDKECANCLNLIQGNVDNILLFDSHPQLAQAHFIYAREEEIKGVEKEGLETLVKELTDAYSKYKNLPTSITTKNTEYLRVWKDALS